MGYVVEECRRDKGAGRDGFVLRDPKTRRLCRDDRGELLTFATRETAQAGIGKADEIERFTAPVEAESLGEPVEVETLVAEAKAKKVK